jgi:hypothetical protein
MIPKSGNRFSEKTMLKQKASVARPRRRPAQALTWINVAPAGIGDSYQNLNVLFESLGGPPCPR